MTIDASLRAESGQLACLCSSGPAQTGATAAIEARNGRAARIAVPAGGFVMFG
ncbi:MAG: hypothetical protein OHM77_08600 [Candidatus Nitricoxidivorans perseverans]|uniref:Uncharacterized protein n=1 Tax=Candidatus Nitricoxidivorans perseverans TaxID=2975601 RepID=A0AA49FJN0_9PROT|nr:MAG: hypothetical protein OHM77_08600 [Candidatus Nitricoxidivorans perseverans]